MAFSKWRFIVALLVATGQHLLVNAEIESVRMTLPASAKTIEVEENYVVGPAFVDLSDLTFTPVDDKADVTLISTVDIAVVRLDDAANKNSIVAASGSSNTAGAKCNGKLDCAGVGIPTAIKGTSLYCCTKAGIQRGYCDAKQFGRLIYQDDVFTGHKRSFQVSPVTSKEPIRLEQDGQVHLYGSGLYALVFANCNADHGLDMEMSGKIVWKSAHGYMYGDLFGVFDAYILLFCLYLALAIWYGRELYMQHFRQTSSALPAEMWILVTILFGLGSVFCDWFHFSILNRTGYNLYSVRATGIFLGGFKQAATRCLALLLAMGEGSSPISWNHPNASRTRPVLRFGLLYLTLSIILDSTVTFLVRQFKTHNMEEEVGVVEFSGIIFVILIVLDIFFFVWLIKAMNRTVEFCSSSNSTAALERYLQLRTVIRVATLATFGILFLSMMHQGAGEKSRRYRWIMDVLDEFTYLAFFTAIAFLWRPTASGNKDCYAPLTMARTSELPSPEEASDLYLELTDSGGSPMAGSVGATTILPTATTNPAPVGVPPPPGTAHHNAASSPPHASSEPILGAGGPWMNSTPSEQLI